MSTEAHSSIDVGVFIDILENEFFHNKETDKSDILTLVQKNSSVEISYKGLEIDTKQEMANLKFKQYGFRFKSDFKVDTRQSIFDSVTILTLVPQKVYEFKDSVDIIREPHCEKGKKLFFLLGDAFERLKIKSNNILQNSASDEMITHYAKKNIQVAMRNCYEAKEILSTIHRTHNQDAINLAIMANAFITNVHAYLLKMFSAYHVEDKILKYKQKSDLLDVILKNATMEPKVEYQTKNDSGVTEMNLPRLKLNIQTNQFLTAIYELMNYRTEENLPLFEIDSKELEELLCKIVYDKKGNLLKKSTINTCLKPSREDKRVCYSKKIDVLPYFDPKKR
ncbi:MAG TPA: hypothetical protein PKN32_05510 [Bacteroidales bacterium]|nr:hypothetical protein [Bacteroidales bacterium]